MSREESIHKLYEIIKAKFEKEGVLNQVRTHLQSKIVAVMKGKDESSKLLRTNAGGANGKKDLRLQLLHQLIVEYFQWHGFHYSLEMFELETGAENTQPMREYLESMLGPFEHKNLPILVELIAEKMEAKKV